MRFAIYGIPPTTNQLYPLLHGNRHVLSEEGRQYHSQIAQVARRLWTGGISSKPFAMKITYYLGGERDRDVDGSHKAFIDGLKDIVWKDDLQLFLLVLEKKYTSDFPHIVVNLRELKTAPIAKPTHTHLAKHPVLQSSSVPPTRNQMYAVVNNRRFKTRPARFAENIWSVLAGKAQISFPSEVHGAICYHLKANRRDVDGSHKLLLDVCTGILWKDDQQLLRLRLRKYIKAEQPQVFMHLWSPSADMQAHSLAKVSSVGKINKSRLNAVADILNSLAEDD